MRRGTDAGSPPAEKIGVTARGGVHDFFEQAP